jgi:hypothetical protein
MLSLCVASFFETSPATNRSETMCVEFQRLAEGRSSFCSLHASGSGNKRFTVVACSVKSENSARKCMGDGCSQSSHNWGFPRWNGILDSYGYSAIKGCLATFGWDSNQLFHFARFCTRIS